MNGTVLTRYLPIDHCLEERPLEVSSEVWGPLTVASDGHSLILVDRQEQPVEVSGEQLVRMKDEDELRIFPATYRLAYLPGGAW